MRRIANKSAFTLVELLVVIGIIAVLIAILLPTLSKARSQSRTVACMSNLRQIGIALRTYAAENQDLLPPGYYPYRNAAGQLVDDTTWPNMVNSYLTKSQNTRLNFNVLEITKVFQCADGMIPDMDVYYSAHPVAMPNYAYPIKIKPYRFSKLRPVTALVWDGVQVRSATDGRYYVAFSAINLDEGTFNPGYIYAGTPAGDFYQEQWYLDDDPAADDPDWGRRFPILPGPNEDTEQAYGQIRWRHRDRTPKSKKGSANILFADGRVETVGQKDLLRDHIMLKR